ncbi:hypothetical protein PP707_06935 [Acetobacter pasteurianus]|nr:hypothetical protein [Acetobacter pasteurianus]
MVLVNDIVVFMNIPSYFWSTSPSPLTAILYISAEFIIVYNRKKKK